MSNSSCSAMTLCRTFVFAGTRGTLEGSQAWRQRRKSTQFVEKSPRQWFANEQCVRPLAFVDPGRDLVSILVTLAHLRTLLAASRTQARPILAAWTDPDRPTSIDLGASTGPERPTSINLGASTYPERPTSIGLLASHDLERSACLVSAMPRL